jgi:pimeloyl-ACP methyl ester carboxylesterase
MGIAFGAALLVGLYLLQVAGWPIFAVGDNDAKFQGIARDLAARMPRAEVAVVPEAGHAAHLENPAAFLQIATEFLSTTPETP